MFFAMVSLSIKMLEHFRIKFKYLLKKKKEKEVSFIKINNI